MIGVRRQQLFLQSFDEQDSIRQPCGRVVVGKKVELFAFFDVIDREGDVFGQSCQEMHFFFVEEILFLGIQGKEAHGFTRHNQRKDRERADSCLDVVLPEQGSWVVFQIVGHDRYLVPDPLRGHGRRRFFIGRENVPDGLQELLVLACTGDRDNLLGGLIHHGNHRHAESAGLDRDPARFPEEFVAIAYPHNEGIDLAEHRIDAIQAFDLEFGLLLFGDVLADTGDSNHLARSGVQNRIVPAEETSFARSCVHLVLDMPCLGRVGEQRLEKRFYVGQFSGNKHFKPVLPDHFLKRPSGKLEQELVAIGDPRIGVQHD